MAAIAAHVKRLSRYVFGVDLVLAGAVIAASTGEPVLAYQLERVRAQAADAALHRGVGGLETT
ncbi:hypothetical protein [Mycolicibacterium sp. 120270]|uniref:hypothetical protein n=1 Tax=Mycolicibacterium sp. 120270 TaxID=3090600 RepID=UPI00299ED436|nr:hypothetical protein [Mycolicibacterium sp. 120270]MDX1881994.1 hypothetical protein [Mycolicibacterium sp. 120270]